MRTDSLQRRSPRRCKPQILLSSLTVATLLTTGCRHLDSQGGPAASKISQTPATNTYSVDHDVVKTAPWFVGDFDAATQAAKTSRKPIFLYWGAVWCPPCNEVKGEVFTQDSFKSLMESAIPIYLDGDSENAQILAERLGVSGYPTMVVLSPDGAELYRAGADLDIHETIDALTAVIQTGDSVVQVIKRAQRGDATPSDWKQIAGISWQQIDFAKVPGWNSEEILRIQLQLINLAPRREIAARARLISEVLRGATALATASPPPSPGSLRIAKTVRMLAPDLLTSIFADPATTRASRNLINNDADATLAFVFGREPSETRTKFVDEWLAAADRIANDATLSVDTRLWAEFPPVDLALAGTKEFSRIPEPVRTDIRAAVQVADARAKTKYQRHAVISGAGYMLQKIGDFDAARELLTREAAQTDTPWYYYSSLATLEREAGRDSDALAWASKARESVQGRASRLQWIVNDLNMSAKVDEFANQSVAGNETENTAVATESKSERIARVLNEYYTTAMSLPDGFSGRNSVRAKAVVREVAPMLATNAALRETVTKFSSDCARLASDESKACREHFRAMLGK